MKLRLTCLTVFLLYFSPLQAQVIVKQHFTKDDQPTDASNSFYYRVGEKVLMEQGEREKWIDTVFIDTVKTFYTSTNAIRSREVYHDGYQEGPYNFYHANGRLQEKGNYKKGRKVGYIIRWTDTGQVKQMLQYFFMEVRKRAEEDSFRIINYWDEANVQIVKDGAGYCKCYFNTNGPIEEGKVVSGYRDSVWRISSGDTLVSFEYYNSGMLRNGESHYRGELYKYEKQFTQAEFPGRMTALMQFLAKNIRYPVQAKRMGIEGRVFTKFIVDKNGVISNLSIIKGVNKDLNQEAIRVVKLMPPWVPGKLRGIPEKTLFVLPIYFKLDF